MVRPTEKYLFAFLGAVTAVVFALAYYSNNFTSENSRTPASQPEMHADPIPYIID